MNILWSLDPFDEKDLIKKGAQLIQKIKSASDTVSVAYVATPAENKLSTAFDVPQEERYTTYPKQIIQNKLLKLKMKTKQIEVIPAFHYSLRSSVQTLLEMVKKNHIDLIVVASKGRKGLPRFVLGSFAETLLFLSYTDILLFRMNTLKSWQRPRKILYAHDFTRKGDKGFAKAIDYATKWNSQLLVYHQPEFAYSIEFEGQDKSVKKLRKKIDEKVEKIESDLRKHKVKGAMLLKQSWVAPSESIMKTAEREKADIILMTSQCGKLMAAVGGSVTRHVVRSTILPVLVVKV